MAQRTFDDIMHTMRSRKSEDHPLKLKMQDTRDRFNGDVVVPLPDVDGEPTSPMLTPNLVADAIENTAMAASSTTPVIDVPALRPSIQQSLTRASTRRKALYASWHHSALLEMILPRSYRQLSGYGTNCLLVVPDFHHNRARVTMRDPLGAYPDYRSPDDASEPLNIGFVFPRSPKWLMANYPESRVLFEDTHKNLARRSPTAASDFLTAPWDVVEWVDEDCIVIGVLGPREQNADYFTPGASDFAANGMELRRWDNRAGRVTAAMPRRITLDRVEGQIAKMTGAIDMLGRLMALDVDAAGKAIYPDMVVFGNNAAPQLLNASGKWNDGRSGEINLVRADGIQVLQSSPGPLTHPVIDRLNANINASIGNSPLFEGRANGASLRTGSALSQMGAYSIDPRVQEMQRLMTRALTTVNESVIEVEKGYWPNRKQVFFSGWSGASGTVEYTPADDFETPANTVSYSIAGADINQTGVAIAQAEGTGLMSKRTARNMHPLITDPAQEDTQLALETVERAIMDSLLVQASQGQLPLIDLVEVYEQYRSTGSWAAAIKAADKAAREREANAAPAPEDMVPGLAAPGMGAEAMPELSGAIPGPTDDLGAFKQLTSALNAAPAGMPR